MQIVAFLNNLRDANKNSEFYDKKEFLICFILPQPIKETRQLQYLWFHLPFTFRFTFEPQILNLFCRFISRFQTHGFPIYNVDYDWDFLSKFDLFNANQCVEFILETKFQTCYIWINFRTQEQDFILQSRNADSKSISRWQIPDWNFE